LRFHRTPTKEKSADRVFSQAMALHVAADDRAIAHQVEGESLMMLPIGVAKAFLAPVVILASTVFGASFDALARPKKLVTEYSCSCGCQYKGANGEQHMGVNAIDFGSSSSCSVFEGRAKICYDSNGDMHTGQMRGCVTLRTSEQGAAPNTGALDSGGFAVPGQPDAAPKSGAVP
jgi:hypothetical protein